MRLRRSLLYMPGSDWRKIEKAARQLNADCVCMDLEDGVALDRKAEARQTVARALQTLDFGHSERLVRVNALDTPLYSADLEAVVPLHPDGIVLPKVSDAARLQALDAQLSELERAAGIAAGSTPLLAIIESAAGVVHLREIAQASPRLVALIFGAEDFATTIGAVPTPHNTEVLYARSKVATYAAAFGLQAIDIVYTNFRDAEGLARETQQGLEMGFSGKQLIHPAQIEIVHQVYTPSAEEIEQARRVVQAFEEQQAAGAGAFALDGRMIDMPLVQQARRVLERAQAAGQSSEEEQMRIG